MILDVLKNLELELYDLEQDPGEQRNLAAEKLDVVAELRGRYERWFEEMRSTRGFQPGVIHLGSKHENPSYLCRYQDGHYPHGSGQPIGWPVKVVRGGRYRLTLKWEKHRGGFLCLAWKGTVTRRSLKPGRQTAEVELPAGEGMLDVWFETTEGKRVVRTTNRSTDGDVEVEFLEGAAN